jgi:O-antigen biosynthesis protein
MSHLLVIASTRPAPRAGSAGHYMLQVLQGFLARGWHVTFAAAETAGEHQADLTALGVREQVIAANTLAPLAQAPDVVLFDHFAVEEQFAGLIAQHYPGALRMLVGNGLRSLREARQQLLRRRLVEGLDPNDFRALFATTGPALYRQMAPSATTQRELAAIWRCDLTLLPGEAELDLLINGFGLPDYLLHHCPITATPAPQPWPPFSERQHFVSLGNFDQAANQDALLWLRHNLWPMLRRRLPDARLDVWGAGAATRAMALHAPDEGFHVRGWAEDTDTLMGNARVCLAPLRFGAGFKGRLLDALRCGTPSVTTPIGAEGLQGRQPWPGAIASSAEGLAEAAARLHSDEAQWNKAQAGCAQWLSQQRDALLVERVEHGLGHLEEQRLYNFTGAMLRRSAKPQ